MPVNGLVIDVQDLFCYSENFCEIRWHVYRKQILCALNKRQFGAATSIFKFVSTDNVFVKYSPGNECYLHDQKVFRKKSSVTEWQWMLWMVWMLGNEC